MRAASAAGDEDKEKAKRKEDYKRLSALFVMLLHSLKDEEATEEALAELAARRSELMADKAIGSFKMSVEEARLLLRSECDKGLTLEDRERRDRLKAALDNIIELCTCAEYQLMLESRDIDDEDVDLEDPAITAPGEGEEDDDDPLLPWWSLNKRYNGAWRVTEEDDAAYAMAVCWQWLKKSESETLTYMTQNDDRVRPWHYALQGFSAPKRDFPSWMIPPIEWACRCFLVSEDGDALVGGKVSVDAVKASVKPPRKPKELDGVFAESVCTGGRIFGPSHSYFSVRRGDKAMLRKITDKIKKDWNVL